MSATTGGTLVRVGISPRVYFFFCISIPEGKLVPTVKGLHMWTSLGSVLYLLSLNPSVCYLSKWSELITDLLLWLLLSEMPASSNGYSNLPLEWSTGTSTELVLAWWSNEMRS
jgi:hypothetical protein